MFHFGRYDLSLQNENGASKSRVQRFVVHHDWNANDAVYLGDIALAILQQSVEFTSLIRPVCLWTSTRSFDDLINRRGTISGWGKTETGDISKDKPLFAEIVVVSEIDCLRSNSVFNKITSPTSNTFCAGGTRSGGVRNLKFIEIAIN